VSTLHITNGSCAGDKLKTFVDGPVVLTMDVLHDGPAPEVDDAEWYALRARFLASDDTANFEAIRGGLAQTDRTIADAAARGDDIVLWFEHDLFDQLLLIRTLDRLARANAQTATLICIDRFPGVTRFIGLGQLEPVELATLLPSRRPVTSNQYALASAAWHAFRSSDPRPLADLAVRLNAASDRVLPFLGDALVRFLAEYPSVENGLTHTELLALSALAERPLAGGALFAATQQHEPRPFIGDSTFFDAVAALARARVPLVSIDGPPEWVDLRRHTVAMSDAGRDVLDGRLDRVALNGIDMWRGGVHLRDGGERLWRWDAGRQRLVS